MPNYTIIESEPFEKKFVELPTFEQERIERFISQIEEKGIWVGKPLSGYSFFREKKFNGNRMYFLCYEEWNAVLLVAIGNKKEQPTTIEDIKNKLPEYKEYVCQKLKEMNLL